MYCQYKFFFNEKKKKKEFKIRSCLIKEAFYTSFGSRGIKGAKLVSSLTDKN